MKKKTAILLITAVVAIAAALAFTACSTTQVTFDLNGGTLDGSGENAVISASGKLDLSTVLPEKEDAEISGWTDEEGNFYGAYSVIEPVEGMVLTAVYKGVMKFTRVDDGYCVSVTEGYAEENVVIPEKYNELPVTEVAENAFAGCTSIKTMRIPDSVKRVGKGALSGCTSLESIVMPFVGASVSDSADAPDSNMAYMFGHSSGSSWTQNYNIAQISVTDAATSIPAGAFEGMKSLKYVNLGKNITAIGQRAFQNCSNLLSVTLPEKCTAIGGYAFYNCSKAQITVKGMITSLGSNSFYTSGLKEITLGEGLTSIPANCFEGSSLRAITLPSTVKSVGRSAFRNCESLISVTTNSTVELNASAFNGCKNLTDAGLAGPEFTFAEGARQTAFGNTNVTKYN